MQHFEIQTILPCHLQEAFEFHMNPHNLTKITPPWIKTELLKPVGRIEVGTILDIKVIRNFIPMTWRVLIKDINAPTFVVDEAMKSPFTYWCHTHHFEESEGQTLMIDSIDFQIPFGWFGLLFIPLIKKDLEKMFIFRHQVSRELLSK